MDKDDPDLQEKELAWVECAERGAAEINAGQLVAAAQGWQQAADIAERCFDPGDPRRAAGWNNLAVLARFAERTEDADRLYRQALQEWDRARGWIERMQPARYARSSVFHMRLELKHRQHFARWALDEYFKQQPRGAAITLNNHAEWYQHAGKPERAGAFYRIALRRYETPGAPPHGAEAMRDNLATCEDFHKRAGDANIRYRVWTAALEETFIVQARREEWIVDLPPEFTDEGRFMAGLACTCLIEQVPADTLRR